VNSLPIGGVYAGEVVDLKLSCKSDGISGDLIVTDKRVVFLKPKSMTELHSIKLEEIRELKVQPAFLGMQLVVDTGYHQYKYSCSKVEGENVVRAVARRKTQVPAQPSFSQPVREGLVREVLLVVCPHCGQRNDATKRKCDKCGASI